MTDDVRPESPLGASGGPQPDSPTDEVAGGAEPWEPPDVTDGFSPGPIGVGEPLPVPDQSSPLDEDEPEGTIPSCPLWAMKDRRHVQWSEIVGFPPKRIREAFGDGDGTVYVIDDGHHHVMVGRTVGTVRDGCKYALVGRTPLSVYETLRAGQLQPSASFDEARDVALCGVDVDENDKASDIFVVESYGAVGAVPSDYLPGRPCVDFPEPLTISGA
jgi:hypothetical protein